ncbi:unnamed protein product, partial [Cladocopium goreaui]
DHSSFSFVETFAGQQNVLAHDPLRRHYPSKFGQKLMEMFDGLISTKTGMPISPAVFPPACSTFSQMSFDDMWDEELERQLADFDAQTSTAGAKSLEELLNDNSRPVATPQNKKFYDAETVPATDSQVEDALSVPSGSKGSPVTSRIMDMYRNGEIDSSLAMQLLGGALATSEDGNSRKRSLDDASGPDEGNKAAKIGEADPDAPFVEELLDQAKKVKNEENALKAKLRRLCEVKKGGRLQDHFIKYKETTRTKTDSKSSNVGNGWYSREDMSKVLKWNKKKIDGAIKVCEADALHLVRKCQYGGDDEYFVNTREHGNSKQEEINAQHEVERTQDGGPAMLGSVKLTREDADASRATAMTSAAAAAATQATRAKDVFGKHVESVLAKCAKVRGLMADLQKNFTDCPTAKKAVHQLNSDLQTLDTQYNMLGDLAAKGERDDHNPEWEREAEKAMKFSTFETAKMHFKKVEKVWLVHQPNDWQQTSAKEPGSQASSISQILTAQAVAADFGKEVPWISAESWLKYLIDKGLWPRLAGCESFDYAGSRENWTTFWEKYEKINPGFELFQMEGIDLSRTAAYFIHDDEGRTLKKGGMLVTSLQSALGRGYDQKRIRVRGPNDRQLQVNFAGHSFTTRFVVSTIPKIAYESQPEVFHAAIEHVAKSCSRLLQSGYVDKARNGELFRIVILGVKGDAPYLSKVAHFYRSYNTATFRVNSLFSMLYKAGDDEAPQLVALARQAQQLPEI